MQKNDISAVPDTAAANGTLGQQVYLSLRQQLLAGQWLPGARLTLRSLAEELGTSIQPVRDAISRLTAERALVLKPNSSVMVPSVEKATLDEIWSLRILLECEAARLCALRMQSVDFEALDEANQATRRHLRQGQSTRSERVWVIQQLAVLLGRMSGSALLSEQIEVLRMRSAPFYAAAMDYEEKAGVVDEEFVIFSIRIQDEFIRALKRGDAESAQQLRGADLYTYQRFIYRCLSLE
jgi:DNA-binding GntR family transcriptional regulator